MSQLVMDNVCRAIVGNTNRTEKKKNKKRRGGRVNRVKRGSDGFVKSLQLDQQHIRDLSSQEESAEKKRKNDILLCRKRLEYTRNFQSMFGYDDIWNDDSTIQLQKLKKINLINLLRMFNVEGRAKLLNNDPMRAALSELAITRASIDLLKSNLLQELEEYGEEYNTDDGALDSSFAADSIADTSIADASFVNTSIVDTSIGDEHSTSNFLESEISAGDARSGSDTENTAELLANIPERKTVTFDEVLSVRTISHQAFSSSEDEEIPRQPTVTIAIAATTTSSFSSSSSSSSEDEELKLHVQRARPRRITRSQNRRTTRASNRAPSTRQQTTRYDNDNESASASASASPSPLPPPPRPPSQPPSQPPSKPVVLRKSLRCRR